MVARPNVTWMPADPSNYTVVSGNRESLYDIQYIIIHTTEGSTASSALNWFQNPGANVSAQYTVDNDGSIYQSVSDNNIAWQAGNWGYNQTSIGIEHVGYSNDPNGWTSAEYQASAQLTAWLSVAYNIPISRTNILGHFETSPSRSDPGPYFDWDYYLDLVRGEISMAYPDLDAQNSGDSYPPYLSSSSVTQGGSVTFTYRASNWGPADAGYSYSGIYRSGNSTISTADTRLMTDYVAALSANTGRWETATISTSGWAPGTYYIGAVADYNNAIAETNESNNPSRSRTH